MKKIEKLKSDQIVGESVSAVIIDITIKINEIIDQLNQSQKQPEGIEYEKRVRVLGELSGSKSEKQPEREYINTEPEKVIVDPLVPDFTGRTDYKVEWKTREEVEKMFKPEKQEGWREVEWLVREITMANEERSRRDRELIDRGEFEDITRKRVTNLISQLLSERTEKVFSEIQKSIKKRDNDKHSYGSHCLAILREVIKDIEEELSKPSKQK